MTHINRTSRCLLVLALTFSLTGFANQVFAVELNPLHWLPSQNEKATAKATKAEQKAWEAEQKAKAAEKEAQTLKEEAERARAEVESLKEQKQQARVSRHEQAKAKKEQMRQIEESQRLEAKHLKESQKAQREALSRRNTSEQNELHSGVSEASNQQEAAQREEANAPNAQAAKHNKSIWNPISWFGHSDETAQNNNAKNKQEPQQAQTMLMQSSSETAVPEEKSEESESRLISRKHDRVKEAPVSLPDGIKQDDVAYYRDARKMKAALIETQRGNIVIELYPDAAPVTVTNFVKLTELGFYNQLGMKFHRVVPGFVIQTGDPTGTGAGGSRDRIPLEIRNKLSHDGKGIVAMARGASPDSATSQFYITLAPQKMLDAKYAIFGRVIQGFDVLEKIEKDDRLYGVKLVDEQTITREDPNAGSKQSLLKKLF